MVERRMRAAIICVASFWYTAWVNAGQPNFDLNPTFQLDTLEIDHFPLSMPEKMIGRQEN
jgi:hypothetical protein